MPKATIDQINAMLSEIKNILDDYSQFMLEIDNTRLNEKENNKFNILDHANKLALQNEQFLPHFLTLERFITDIEYFAEFRNLINLSGQIQDKLWDMTSKSAEVTHKEALTA
jgi:type IV secretory pathway ATPase VirB11/archaellum biosynthesis ATPase